MSASLSGWLAFRTNMDEKLQNKLYSKYPKIFGQKDLPMNQTCMCWGISHSDGWYDILDRLCNLIQWHVDQKDLPQVEAVQVKEKFGTLRFYVNHQDDYISGCIAMAESMSARTCELCGKPGKLYSRGWWVTRCLEHAKEEGRLEDEAEGNNDEEDDGC